MIDRTFRHRPAPILLAGMLAAFLLSACQTARPTEEMTVVPEADQPLIFTAPGLENATRRFRTGDPYGRNHEVVFATYAPARGNLPHASIIYIGARGGMHFTNKKSVMKDMSEGWNYHATRTLTEISGGRAVNELGAAEYSVFTSDDASCVGFLQFFGDAQDDGYGTDQITGYYCAPEGVTLTDADARSILKRLGHRTKGMPQG
ncbi:MAG: hypothetical protein RJQ21_03760 [Rhodospirillales bacterium]